MRGITDQESPVWPEGKSSEPSSSTWLSVVTTKNAFNPLSTGLGHDPIVRGN